MKNKTINLNLEEADIFFKENPEMFTAILNYLDTHEGNLPEGGLNVFSPNKGIGIKINAKPVTEVSENTGVTHNGKAAVPVTQKQKIQDPVQTDMESKVVLKADNGKPRLDLVPLEGLVPMARVREFALTKYGEKGIEAWRDISDERLLAALLRHLMAYQMNPKAVDEESGLPAIYHVEANAMFLAIKAFERIANSEKNSDPRFVEQCLH